MTLPGNKRVKCPVCGDERWDYTLKGHITRTAQVEVLEQVRGMLDAAKNKPYKFSPIVFLNQCPHEKFRRKHINNVKVFEL